MFIMERVIFSVGWKWIMMLLLKQSLGPLVILTHINCLMPKVIVGNDLTYPGFLCDMVLKTLRLVHAHFVL